MPPLAPVLVVPELKLSDPLVPVAPLLELLNSIHPLDVDMPYPEHSHTPPPVSVVLEPAPTVILPPTARSPCPTVKLILPADP